MFIDCFMCSIIAGLLNSSTCSSSPQICGSFSARAGIQGHIKMHHAHTNVIGLGDSSVWKVPFLPRTIYLFIAPLAVPIITPLVALGKRCQRTKDVCFKVKCETQHKVETLFKPCDPPRVSVLPRLCHCSASLLSCALSWFCSSAQRTIFGPHP